MSCYMCTACRCCHACQSLHSLHVPLPHLDCKLWEGRRGWGGVGDPKPHCSWWSQCRTESTTHPVLPSLVGSSLSGHLALTEPLRRECHPIFQMVKLNLRERTKGMTPKHSVQLTEQPFLPLSSLSPANRPTHRGQITLLELPSGCLHLCLSIANLYPDVPLTGHPPRRAFLLHLPPLETKDSHLPAAWGTEWFQT